MLPQAVEKGNWEGIQIQTKNNPGCNSKNIKSTKLLVNYAEFKLDILT